MAVFAKGVFVCFVKEKITFSPVFLAQTAMGYRSAKYLNQITWLGWNIYL